MEVSLPYFGILFLVTIALGQIPIPPRMTGYTYKQPSRVPSVKIGFYIGPLCPDSQQAFPTLLNVASSYAAEDVSLVTHLFPLPFHHHSFLAAKGAHIVANMTEGKGVYQWLNLVYKNIASFGNDATYKKTEEQVEEMYAVLATQMNLNKEQFQRMFSDEDLEQDTRIGWKYTSTRGIAWTPAFMINDVLVQADPTWTVTQWKQVLDPLVKNQNQENSWKQYSNEVSNTTCKAGTRRCEFLPGKIECCTPGEGCIPNVGCRC